MRRYVQKTKENGQSIHHDERLDRDVFIHWVAQASSRELVRERLVKLQSVQCPYLALVYDIVDEGEQVGVVEEDLPDPVEVTLENRTRRIYEFCAALSALHEDGLAHGNLDEHCFRKGALGQGRLCNLAFAEDGLDDGGTDVAGFISCLNRMGAPDIADEIWQQRWMSVVRLKRMNVDVLKALRDRLKALLLLDRHRALVYWRGKSRELSAKQRSQTLVHPISTIVATMKIEYDGTRFFVAAFDGEVRINNCALTVGQDLPQSCLIVLGDSTRPSTQKYSVTFDQSHPEVL